MIIKSASRIKSQINIIISNNFNLFENKGYVFTYLCCHYYCYSVDHNDDDVYILGFSAVVNSKTEKKEAEKKKKKRRKNE